MNKISSAKVRCGNWTPEETELFVANEDNRFAAGLERLASKKQPTTKYLVILKKYLKRAR